MLNLILPDIKYPENPGHCERTKKYNTRKKEGKYYVKVSESIENKIIQEKFFNQNGGTYQSTRIIKTPHMKDHKMKFLS